MKQNSKTEWLAPILIALFATAGIGGPVGDPYEPNDGPPPAGDTYNLSQKENTWLSSLLGRGISAKFTGSVNAWGNTDADFFCIDVSKNHEKVVIECLFDSGLGDIDIALYGAMPAHFLDLLAVSNSNDDNERIEFTVPSPGRYYILVTNKSVTDNEYDLRWDDLLPGPDTEDPVIKWKGSRKLKRAVTRIRGTIIDNSGENGSNGVLAAIWRGPGTGLKGLTTKGPNGNFVIRYRAGSRKRARIVVNASDQTGNTSKSKRVLSR